MKNFLLLFCCAFILQAAAQTTMTADKWQQDLNFLRETVNKDYAFLFRKTSAEAFNSAADQLSTDIPNLEDHEVIVGLAKLVSMFQYGHTDISFRHEPFAFSHLPLNLYYFNDGLYIQGVHKDYENALGTEVIAVAGVPIDEALKAIYPVVPAENSQYFKAFGINYLRIPEVLHAVGIIPELTNEVSFSLEKGGQPMEVTFKALPKGQRPPVEYSLIRQDGDWLEARDQASTPYYLKNLDKRYYYEYLPEEKTVYVRHSQVLHEDDEDIPAFFGKVYDFIENNEVEKLVLDVRLNGGGNNYNNKEVVRGLVQTEKIDQVGKFFVILGRRTFSACQNLVNELDNYTNAIFVGEPTAENINFYGDNNRVELPNSGIPVFLSFAWWQDKPQWEDGPWLAPHIAVDMSFEDYTSNRDPVLQTALDFDGEDFITDPMQYMTALYQAGEREKLMSEAKRMIADPRYKFFNFEGELNRTGYRMLDKNPQEAIAVFGFVTQLFPESANAWDSLAEAHWKAGLVQEAIGLYQKAAAMDPNGPVGKNAREKLAEIKAQ